MLNISTKGDYGLLLMSALAEKMRGGRGFVSLKEISKEKHISLPYLSQIILPLKNAGLVASKEGREGGYRLAKPAVEITMIEILEALEGPLAPVRCCGRKSSCACESVCGVKNTWAGAKNLLADFLRSKTLEDILSLRSAEGGEAISEIAAPPRGSQ